MIFESAKVEIVEISEVFSIVFSKDSYKQVEISRKRERQDD